MEKQKLTPETLKKHFLDWLNTKSDEEKYLIIKLWSKTKDQFPDQFKLLDNEKFETLITSFAVKLSKTFVCYPEEADIFNIYIGDIEDTKIDKLPSGLSAKKYPTFEFKNGIFLRDLGNGKSPCFRDLFSILDSTQLDKKLLTMYKIFQKFKKEIVGELIASQKQTEIKVELIETLKPKSITVIKKEPILLKGKLIATESGVIKDLPTVLHFANQLKQLFQTQGVHLRDELILRNLNPNNMRLFVKTDGTLFLTVYRQNITFITLENVGGMPVIHRPITGFKYIDGKKGNWQSFCNDGLYLGQANFRYTPEENFEEHVQKIIRLSGVKFDRSIKNSAENQLLLPCGIPVAFIDSNVTFESSIKNLSNHKGFAFMGKDEMKEVGEGILGYSMLRLPGFDSAIALETTIL